MTNIAGLNESIRDGAELRMLWEYVIDDVTNDAAIDNILRAIDARPNTFDVVGLIRGLRADARRARTLEHKGVELCQALGVIMLAAHELLRQAPESADSVAAADMRNLLAVGNELLRERMSAANRVTDFGREVLAAILADRNFFESEESERWCELLAKFGYVEKVKYDPETHGDIDGAEPGFDVWMFTDAAWAAAKVSE